jgi:hypothetical protein
VTEGLVLITYKVIAFLLPPLLVGIYFRSRDAGLRALAAVAIATPPTVVALLAFGYWAEDAAGDDGLEGASLVAGEFFLLGIIVFAVGFSALIGATFARKGAPPHALGSLLAAGCAMLLTLLAFAPFLLAANACATGSDFPFGVDCWAN